jgi:hypothetical protein
MTQLLTDSISVLAEYQVDLIKNNATTLLLPTLPSGDVPVFYGDQQLIPVTPTICVESGPRQRILNNTGLATEIDFTTFFLVYHGKLQDSQLNKLECDQYAEQVEVILHSDMQMGGLVIFGLVTVIDPGIAMRSGTMMRATRITWNGRSRVCI